MATNITAKKFELSQSIRAYIEEKTALLHKHYTHIQTIDVEVDRQTNHRKGEIYHVRINVQVPHELLHAEEMASDLYAAIDMCKDDVDRQLRAHKEKRETQRRNAQKTRRSLKSFFGFRS